MVPLDSLMKHGKLVHGSVVSVDPSAKQVKLEDGTAIPYDVLLLAPGGRSFSPGEPPAKVSTKAGTEAFYNEMHVAIAMSKSVVIVGGGPVAIELAGEIKAHGQKDVKVTLVNKAPQLLAGPTPPTPGNLAAVGELLKSEQVDVICNDEVASVPFPQDIANASPIVPTPQGVTLKSGKQVSCDLLIFAVGGKLNTDFLPREWVDGKTGEVLVDEKTLKLQSRDDVFCIGEAAKSSHIKLGYFFKQDGKVVAKNILQVLEGKQPTNTISRSSLVMVIPFGPKRGRLLMPFTTLGDWATSLAKGKGLFTKMHWSEFAPGKTPPEPTA